jgi:osmotically-inducible protein OsmY
MANNRWDDEDLYRARRYGHDSDYDRDFWRDREARRREWRGRQALPGWYEDNDRYYGYGDDWRARGGGERSWWDRTKDEVRSWMGDTDAELRREADHRGRGPRGYTRSDERIREDVSDRLMEDRYVDATDIEVTIAGAEVTLSGTVASREAKRRAENIAADVLGVKDVQNRLRVQPRSTSETGERTGTSAQASTQGERIITGSSSTPHH